MRRRHQLAELKLVLITNASMFHREAVRQALEVLDANNGEIWAKLDAGTEAYYREVARSSVPFQRMLDNLASAARGAADRDSVAIHADSWQPPSAAEQAAYCDRLGEITAAGGQIKLVQIHTIARMPAESWVASLSRAEIDDLVELVRRRTGLLVAGFGSGS